jgi:hypothetical protein
MACVCLAGCKGDPPRNYTPPPPPAKLEYVLKAGDNLEAIATDAYGHGRYHLLIAQHNHIENVTRLQIGQRIATPGIVEMFRSAGLDSTFDHDITALAWAVAEYHNILPFYEAMRRQREKPGASHIDLPKDYARRLDEIADAVEFVVSDIERKTKTASRQPRDEVPQRLERAGPVAEIRRPVAPRA